MGKMFFNILATFAEFEVDLLRLRTKEGMAIAKANGKLKGKPPKLNPRQQAHLVKLHREGSHRIPELADLFSVSRPTVYRVLDKARHVMAFGYVSQLVVVSVLVQVSVPGPPSAVSLAPSPPLIVSEKPVRTGRSLSLPFWASP
jgi:hypothetical protein